MNEYEQAVNYIKMHAGDDAVRVLKIFHDDVQYHKDNAAPFDYMTLAHYALREFDL
jgi:hypothetical protein